jgi:murein DD-endopeptidase MepM/ murein hydrolase activator NlpD
MKLISFLGLFFSLAALSSCTSAPNPEILMTSTITPEVTFSAPTSLPSSTFETTLPLLSPTPSLLVITTFPAPLPTSTTNYIQLFFPTVIPAEGAEYRPPLYTVPWALSPFDHFYFTAPIAATYPGDPVADYRYGGIYFGPDVIHTGIDLPAPRGAEVLAAGPGTVVWAGIGLYSGSVNNLKDPYGLAVAIRHDFGYEDQPLFSIYAHMDEVDVVVGQWINTGYIIGKVGDTGNTTGPHLHFEVRLGENDFWTTRNPELWLSPPQGYGVLVGQVTSTSGDLLPSYLVYVRSLESGKQSSVETYGPSIVNCDQYYQENLVMGDLPAGSYELIIPYLGWNSRAKFHILPGQVTFFTFKGYFGYNFNLPSVSNTDLP